MDKMTSRERIARMYEHKDADRVPILDGPWNSTLERWQREGMPKDADWTDYFGVDKIAGIGVDISPQYEKKTVEETDEYIIYTTEFGATMKNWKHKASVPDFLDFKTTTYEAWLEAKARMIPGEDARIPWKVLEENFEKWKSMGYWISAGFNFGFDISHSWVVGTETFLFALAEQPEWAEDMFAHYLEMCISLFEKVWDAGYHFDEIFWCDDMGYKGTQFFSKRTYKKLLLPYQKKAVEFAHDRGVKARLHSCGNIMPFVPELVDIGLDALNPLEIKAGMDPLKIKEEFGDKLVLHGGINAVLWDKPEEIKAEIAEYVPKLKENGGYIFASDHSIPDSVSLEQFRDIIKCVKEYGAY